MHEHNIHQEKFNTRSSTRYGSCCTADTTTRVSMIHLFPDCLQIKKEGKKGYDAYIFAKPGQYRMQQHQSISYSYIAVI